MLSPGELRAFKQGGKLATALARTDDKVTLGRTLSAIEYQRCQRLREIETCRRQFLHFYREKVYRRSSSAQNVTPKKRDKLTVGKEREVRCKTSLNIRTAEFLDGLSSRPLTGGVREKNLLEQLQENADAISSTQLKDNEKEKEECKLQQDETENTETNKYRKGLQLLNKRKRDRLDPFITSVNTVLEKLRSNSEGQTETQKSFIKLTNHILTKYVKDDLDKEEMKKVSDSIEQFSEHEEEKFEGAKPPIPSKPAIVLPSIQGAEVLSRNESTSSNREEITNEDYNKSNEGIMPQTTASTPLEGQRSMKRSGNTGAPKHATEQNKALTPVNVSLPLDGAERGAISIHIIPPPCPIGATPSYVNAEISSSKTIDSEHSNSTIGYHRQGNPGHVVTKPNTTVHEKKSTGVAVFQKKVPIQLSINMLKAHNQNYENSSRRGSSATNNSLMGQREQRKNSIGSSRKNSMTATSPKDALLINRMQGEDKPQVNRSKTVILVHHDEDGDDVSKKKPECMFSERRLSYCGNDEPLNKTNGMKAPMENPVSCEVENIEVQSVRSSCVESDPVEGTENASPVDEENSERNITPSTVPSLKLFSRQDSKEPKGRRLSVQTTGSLRMWANVQREEMISQEKKMEDDVHIDGEDYKKIVNALAVVAAQADDQAQRLEAVKQYRPNFATRTSLENMVPSPITGDTSFRRGSLSGRRNSIVAPSSSGTTADVTDEVFKFLQKRHPNENLQESLGGPDRQAAGCDVTDQSARVSRRISASRHPSQSRPESGLSGDQNKAGRTPLSWRQHEEPSKTANLQTSVFEMMGGSTRRNSIAVSGEVADIPSPKLLGDISETESAASQSTKAYYGRSYSWAPDMSRTNQWHILALELLARNRKGIAKFRTVTHLLQCLSDEYKQQTASMLYEELAYCTYLRIPKHYIPDKLREKHILSVFDKD